MHAVSPLHFAGQVYAVSGYGTGGVLLELSDDGTRVKRKWRDDTLDNHHGGVVLVDGHLYGGTGRPVAAAGQAAGEDPHVVAVVGDRKRIGAQVVERGRGLEGRDDPEVAILDQALTGIRPIPRLPKFVDRASPGG